MKLSTRGRYAVMAIMDLAVSTDGRADAKPVTLSEIASRQDISLSYLEQLFAKLRRADIVLSARGPGGGYTLSKTPEMIRIADIILAVDEPIRVTRCGSEKSGGCMGSKGRCLTHDLWEQLGNQIHGFLNTVTVADVMKNQILGKTGLFHPTPLSCDKIAAAS